MFLKEFFFEKQSFSREMCVCFHAEFRPLFLEKPPPYSCRSPRCNCLTLKTQYPPPTKAIWNKDALMTQKELAKSRGNYAAFHYTKCPYIYSLMQSHNLLSQKNCKSTKMHCMSHQDNFSCVRKMSHQGNFLGSWEEKCPLLSSYAAAYLMPGCVF